MLRRVWKTCKRKASLRDKQTHMHTLGVKRLKHDNPADATHATNASWPAPLSFRTHALETTELTQPSTQLMPRATARYVHATQHSCMGRLAM